MPNGTENLTQIVNPEALGSFTEEQLVRPEGTDNIFLAEGTQIPEGVDMSFFNIPQAPVPETPPAAPATTSPTEAPVTDEAVITPIQPIQTDDFGVQYSQNAEGNTIFYDPNTNTWGLEVPEGTPQDQLSTLASQIDQDTNTTISALDALQATADSINASLIQSIKDTYNTRRATQKQINANALGAITKAGIRSNRQRFAPEIQTGILSAEESAGLARITALDNEEKSLILQAEQAKNENDFTMLSTKMTALKENRAEKRQALMDQISLAQQEEQLALQKAADQRAQVKLDLQVKQFIQSNLKAEQDLLTSGFTEIDATETTNFDRERIFTDPISGKTFLRPEEFDTQIIEADGRIRLINTQTGDIISDLGEANNLTPLDMLKIREAGYDLDETGNLTEAEFMPSVGSSVETNLGNSTITAYGSPLWEHGLDMVLEGGKGATVVAPFDFKVVEIVPPEESKGFGNQVRVVTRDGQEVWFSHLDSTNMLSKENPASKDGFFTAGTILGTQGNTGQTIASAGGDGTHIDITMPKVDNPNGQTPSDWLSPQEVGQFLGILPTTSGRTGELSSLEDLKAKNLAVEIFGKRAGTKEENINPIRELMLDGQNVDEIRDTLRFSAQSTAFEGTMRDAAESIAIGLSSDKQERFFDSLDRSLEDGNLERARELLTRTAIESLGTEEAKKVRGDMRAVELFDEIAADLRSYENMGGSTNIFKGTGEKVLEKIGETSNPVLAELANKIQIGIQTYRKSISGSAFTESEAKEYKAIFPSIDKTSDLNFAKLRSAQEVLKGNSDFVLQSIIGKEAFTDIFADITDDLIDQLSPEQLQELQDNNLL